MDYYSVLGLGKNASQDEIKSAYRKLAMQYHPDRNPGDKEAENKFKEVQQAYDSLTNSSPARHTPPPHTYSNIWETFFGTSPAPEKERGRSVYVNVEIELKDVLAGCVKTVSVPQKVKCEKCDGKGFSDYKNCPTCGGAGKIAIKQSPFNVYIGCAACGGQGKAGSSPCEPCNGKGSIEKAKVELNVNIPPGVESGQKMAVPGYGEASTGKNGDLIIVVLVKNHKYFMRQGANIILEYPVSYSELCLGAKVEIPTISGEAILTIPPMTADGTNFYLKGMGVPYQGSAIKGDMIVVVKMILPSKSRVGEYKTLLESLADLDKEALTQERNLYK